jgi:hypothetical protein
VGLIDRVPAGELTFERGLQCLLSRLGHLSIMTGDRTGDRLAYMADGAQPSRQRNGDGRHFQRLTFVNSSRTALLSSSKRILD